MKYKVNQQLVAINNLKINCDIEIKKGFGYKVERVYKSCISLKIEENNNLLLDEKEANSYFVIYKGCHK